MFFVIPGALIALLTFPGVILHEISHRFFCDINNVPVYDINYFCFDSDRSGYVIHAHTDSFWKRFFISFGPLIINSLVFIIFMIPLGIKYFFGKDFLATSYSELDLFLMMILTWIGISCGFHSIPSNNDVDGLSDAAESTLQKILSFMLTGIVHIFNIKGISFWIRIIYIYLVSMIVPSIFFS